MKRLQTRVNDDLYAQIVEDAGEESIAEWLRDACRLKLRHESTFTARAPAETVQTSEDEEAQTELEKVLRRIEETAREARKP